MTPNKTQEPFLIRYSPRPQQEYVGNAKGTPFGPAASGLITTIQTWNLAYLSFDFEKSLMHPDPHFTTNVLRTCQMRLDGGGVDMIGKYSHRELFGSLLDMPAPQFVHTVTNHPLLPSLPIYKAYGPSWLMTIDKRARLCCADDVPDDAITDLSLAASLLAKFQ